MSDSLNKTFDSSVNNDAVIDAPTIKNNLTRQIGIVVFITLLGLTSILGIITNSINIRVFLKMKLKDSVTISLFTLACSDLMVSMTTLLWVVCALLVLLDAMLYSLLLPFATMSMLVVLANVSEYFRLVSSLSTCFLAFLRTMCVVVPFRFKFWFTAKMSARVNCVLSIISLFHLSIFTHIDLRFVTDANNSTKLTLVYKESYSDVNQAISFLNGPVLSCGSMVVTSICVAIMIHRLRKRLPKLPSVKGRLSVCVPNLNTDVSSPSSGDLQTNVKGSIHLSVSTITTTNSASPSEAIQTDTECPTLKDNDKAQRGFGRDFRSIKSTEETQSRRIKSKAITQIALLSSMFIVFNIPTAMTTIIHFNQHNAVENVHLTPLEFLALSLRQMGVAVCAAINIFVYLKYNTRYKMTYQQLCC